MIVMQYVGMLDPKLVEKLQKHFPEDAKSSFLLPVHVTKYGMLWVDEPTQENT